MKKLLLISALVFLAASGLTYGQGINWFGCVISTNYMFYANGTTYLDGNATEGLGCFVQLLYVGANGIADTAWNSGDGAMVDDVVVDWCWVGAGAALGDDGWFDGASVGAGGSVVSNNMYFARVWSAPAANYASGLVPTSLTNRYANSVLWQYPEVNPLGDNFEISPDGSAAIRTTLSPIPEPAVFGLGILGLISLRFFSRKRK